MVGHSAPCTADFLGCRQRRIRSTRVEGHNDAQSTQRRGVRSDAAMIAFDDTLDNGQSQALPLGTLVAADAALEHCGKSVRIQPRPVVVDPQAQALRLALDECASRLART